MEGKAEGCGKDRQAQQTAREGEEVAVCKQVKS